MFQSIFFSKYLREAYQKITIALDIYDQACQLIFIERIVKDKKKLKTLNEVNCNR